MRRRKRCEKDGEVGSGKMKERERVLVLQSDTPTRLMWLKTVKDPLPFNSPTLPIQSTQREVREREDSVVHRRDSVDKG